MCTKSLKKWALLLTFWVALRYSPLKATTTTISSDLQVTGVADVEGNTLSLGTDTVTSSQGWQMLYTDGTLSQMEFDAVRGTNQWYWQQNGGATLQPQMSLSSGNTLTLYNSSGTAEITLNPTGTSTFTNSVTLNGTDNEMPNQTTLVNAHSVLTKGLGDARYLSLTALSLALLPDASATGEYSTALGYYTSASGKYSTAMGAFSTTSNYEATALGHSTANGFISTAEGKSVTNGNYSTAMGESTASGNYSTATGRSTATGNYSIAIGRYSTASGIASMAMGESTASGYQSMAMGSSNASGSYSMATGKSTASGDYSAAMGSTTSAQAFGSVAIGQFNVGGGDPHDWVLTDPLFEIGNGTTSSYYYNPSTGSGYYIPIGSDAFVVYKNGNALVQGTLAAHTGLRCAPTGDLSMGTFTAGTAP